MQPTLRVILCPHCAKFLYALGLDASSEGARWRITEDSPTVQKSGKDHFVVCRNCTKKVALKKGPESVGADWLVDGRSAAEL